MSRKFDEKEVALIFRQATELASPVEDQRETPSASDLGGGLDYQGPDDDQPFYCRVSRDGIGIMLKAILPDVHPRPNRTQHEWARWDAYILTSDPEALHEEFRQSGVSFVNELSRVDVGLWGFEIEDADGYVLCFARPDHT